MDYMESDGNQNHPQQEGNLDIFSGFRNWWHVNITNNSKLLGGLGLGDQNNNNQKNSAHYGRGNASSPTVMDPKSGIYGKHGKRDGMHLMNMTQMTRSDIRNKQQKMRDVNSNSNNFHLPYEIENNRESSSTLQFNETNFQNSAGGDFQRQRGEMMP